MSVDRETQDKSQPFHKRIDAHPDWSGVTHGRMPNWYGRMLTVLVLATEAESLVYLTASLSSEGSELTARVVTFTTNLLVIADVSGKVNQDSATVTVTVRPRRALSNYTMEADGSIFGHDAFEDWPGQLQSTVTYSDGTMLTIPIGRTHTSSYRDEIGELIRSFRGDVVTL